MFDRFTRTLAALVLFVTFAAVADARNRQAEKFFNDGRSAEVRKEWDKALELYEKALGADPSNVAYDLAAKRVRFQSAAAHIEAGQKLRASGELDQALAEFQKAYATDPSSSIAEQEVKRTVEMIERAKKEGASAKPGERGLTAAELAKKREAEMLSRLEAPPELKPLSRQPINLRMANQPPRVLFETVGKLAGINVVFDPDYGQQGGVNRAGVELNNSTLEDALDYLATMTRSFWKPLSANAIFVTQENQQKRREYEDNVVRVFYLSNLTTPQELQEISTVIRTVADVKKVFTYASMNAIIVRGTPDQITLADKLVYDLDKPKSEVVVDVLVMEANKSKTRNLGAAIASGGKSGLNTGIQFTPRNPILQGGTGDTPTTDPITGLPVSGSGGSTTTQQLISLARISKISTNDFSVTLPGALLQAMMSDQSTRVLQSPQVRAASGQKASLKIGQKVPIASGGLQPFGGTVGGFSSLYSQFQFQDVGVNVDITPTVHGSDEVTLKVALDISSVVDRIDIAGVSQPVIGQRKIEHEIRVRQGEVSLIGGLMQDQDTKAVNGVPGLASIPGLKWLFSTESVTRDRGELLIALIPHIVRTPGITDVNMRPVAAGTETVTRLSLARAAEEAPAAAAPAVETAPAPVAPEQPAQPAPEPAAPAPAAQLLFRPGTVQVQPGAIFTLQLDADNVRDLFSAPFHLKFDPQLLKLQEVKAGTLMSSDGQKIIFTRNILNDSGDATVNLNRLPGSSGVGGSGSLAVFTFQALKPGTAVVMFTELGAKNSQGQPVSQDMPHASITIK
ncbi:MAG: cohesin domain-containing protein [Acidobacteriota bacterium]